MIYTKRDRVKRIFAHKEADKVPIDFGSTRSTGINAFAYYNLKRYLNLKGPVKVYDIKQLLAVPDPEVLELTQSDCIQLHRLSPHSGVRVDRWKLMRLMDGNEYEVPDNFRPMELADGSMAIVDGNGTVLLRRPKDGLYYDDVYTPLADACSKEEIDCFSYPKVTDEELSYVTKRAEDIYNGTEYAIVYSTGISIFEKGIKDFGYEEFLVKIYTDENLITRYLENLTEAYLKMLDQYIASIGKYVQVFQFNDDLGIQQSTIIQPEVYRKVFKQHHQRIFRHVREKSPHIKTLLHSCGSIYDLIPDFIEIGVDAINPVQTNAAKMDPIILKREFGKHITFWGGGCSTQTTLTFGSINDIKEETKRMINILSPGGGFVFNQVHNIQSNISPEKIIALYDTAIAQRRYFT